MKEWKAFAVVVGAQLAIFLLLAAWQRKRAAISPSMLVKSAIVGILVGVGFDVLVGAHMTVFTYHISSSPLFLLVNGIFSYGVALATAGLFPIDLPLQTSKRDLPMTLALAAIVAALSIARFGRGNLVSTILAGVTILLSGEALVAWSGRLGPLVSLTFGKAKPFAVLWLFSIVIGLLYEIANWFSPVWIWQAPPGVSDWMLAILIVVFGYFVLFHLLWVASRFAGDYFAVKSSRQI